MREFFLLSVNFLELYGPILVAELNFGSFVFSEKPVFGNV
ncbi:hypothetical protein LEP1GSC038_2340 [Leptospira weilii str. 2006001855]|uniref:Uncharacterized protein n=2 Tax=Leptospira weilii TaxID=28184 RepID=M6Q4U0_9LEPT|nr:hypothetical protein LEP1GSC051_2998 [Leptospira sp. P2653]EMM71157.1 hypothetical protein LEP1GSC038_2340 [Leptospira weilii str. 2006001855]EMN42533.1 hypothetical protein LEP1GSC086_1410 [Leptospira weilii str. LNT 1234]EMN90314.1 hypothetical protein LEP1GSC108_3507 [Leptospira weilii str. UI 13098]